MTANLSNQQLISPSTLKQLLEEEAVTLCDVREPGEYAGEHIAGATLVPLSSFSPQKLPKTNKKLVLYCQSGRRSSQAAQQLRNSGLMTEFMELQGGLNAWKDAGYETKINRHAPISIMRQVQIVAGSLVLIGTILGAFVSPWFLLLSGFVGAGLTFAGATNTCMLGMLLAKLPYNQVANK